MGVRAQTLSGTAVLAAVALGSGPAWSQDAPRTLEELAQNPALGPYVMTMFAGSHSNVAGNPVE